MDQPKKLHPATASIIIILLVISLTAGVILATNRSGSDEQTTEQAAPTTNSTETNQPAATGTYADGTYTAEGTYFSPGGRESIDVSVTLNDGIIANTSLTTNATSGEAEEYQSQFAAGYKERVIGKNIDEVSLDRVAGSSLTPNGFNNALQQIKDDARA